LIRIFTFVTDPAVYEQMRHSFEQAGFTGDHATFSELRGGGMPGEPEPYSKITELVAEVTDPFFILCHQDLRLDQGHGVDELLAAIRDLEKRDERWAVAGNAGGSRSLRVIRSLEDRHGGTSDDVLPSAVHSLDENFLVIRAGTGISCSAELAGFHLYGTDLCLNALESGWQPYVIDFRLHHLGVGRKDAAYYAALDGFVSHWSSRVVARYVRTTVELLFLGRWRWLRTVLGWAAVRRMLKNHRLLSGPVGALLAPRQRAPKRNSTAGRRASP
jgi:hypothetical protein